MITRIVPTCVLLLAAAGTVLALDPGTNPSPGAPVQDVRHDTVTVTATGSAGAAATFLRLRTTLSGNAEQGLDAIEDYEQARLRAMGAFEGSGLAGVEVLALGIDMDYVPEVKQDPNMGFIMASNGMETPDPGVTCSEKIEVRFRPEGDPAAQREQVAHAIDLAVELGLKLSSKNNVNPYVYNPMQQANAEGPVVGGLDDEATASLERNAQAVAMQRARALADNLAQLSGRTLGPVDAIVLGNLSTTWKGLGHGMESSASVTVTFRLN